ncbi:MAG: transcriptional regulator [Bacilli bacterium]|nr:transcriptional regulator [Bacilli bacterium]MDD7374635.1 transcriptional regulator [Bacilli bacterium]MDD7549204.1 transcriptional regulator [Bacilli bacterium]MDD7599047.1 transcriptional regulator [Bacilli bacterium]MDY4155688.1 transcriptional regulator [Bacilli bacterium]
MDKKVLENIRQSLLDIYRMEVIDGIRDILSGENSFLLLLLSCSSSPLTASFMAERLNITKGRITALISSLLDKEDIEITLDMKDRRKTLIRLTEKGRNRIETKIDEVNEKLEYLIRDLSIEEVNVLLNILEKVKNRGE